MKESMKEIFEKEIWTDEDVWMIALDFDRMTQFWARKNAGNGAEFDDLHQEGRIGAFLIVKKCKHRVLLRAYIAHSLPGYIRNVANAMRWKKGDVALDSESYATVHIDPEVEREISRCELDDLVCGVLSGETLRLAEMRLDGMTEREIAAELGISQQAVAKRMKKVRELLRPYLDDLMSDMGRSDE